MSDHVVEGQAREQGVAGMHGSAQSVTVDQAGRDHAKETGAGVHLLSPEAKVVGDFLGARRVAVIGASSGERDHMSFNARVTKLVLGSEGIDEVVLVSKSSSTIAGHETYGRIADYPGQPGDLCIVIVHHSVLIETIVDAEGAGWTHFIVVTGQLSADEAAELQKLAPSRVRVWGPNCIGFYDVKAKKYLLAGGNHIEFELLEGRKRVAVVGQSGGALIEIAHLAVESGLCVSHVMSTGSESDVSVEDTLFYLAESGTTDVVIAFVEQARDPKAFLAALDRCAASGVGVVAIKVGRSERSKAAAENHSGALVGDAEEFDAAVTAHGAILCTSSREAAGVASFVANLGPCGEPPRLAIYTGSGGIGALACDLADELGLGLAQFSEHSLSAFSQIGFAPEETNPLDGVNVTVTYDEGRRTFLNIAGADPEVDVLVLMHTTNTYGQEFANAIAERTTDKPVVVVWAGAKPELREMLLDSGCAVFDDAGDALRWLALATGAVGARRFSFEPAAVVQPSSSDDDAMGAAVESRWQTYHEASDLIRNHGVDAPVQRFLEAGENLDRVVADVSQYPVVVKASSLSGHKAALGGVRRGIEDSDSLQAALADMLPRFGSLVIEEQAPRGVEVLVSLMDGPFGGLVLVGLGGAHADIYGKQAIFSVGESTESIVQGIARSGVGAMLQHHSRRDAGESSILALAEQIGKLGQMIAGGVAASIEINPFIVSEDRAVACDVKLQKQAGPEARR